MREVLCVGCLDQVAAIYGRVLRDSCGGRIDHIFLLGPVRVKDFRFQNGNVKVLDL